MKPVLMGLVVVVLLSTVGVYATAAGGQPPTLGCTEEMAITSPTSSPVTIGWAYNGAAEIVAAEVRWTPNESSNYQLVAVVGSNTGTLSLEDSGTASRTDIVPVSPSLPAESAFSANLTITQRVVSPDGSSASTGWMLSDTGQVTAGLVNWTPGEDASYHLALSLEGSLGELSIAESGVASRTDIVPILPAVGAESASSTVLCITQG